MNNSILLFRPDHIGDFLLTTPAIHALKSSFPDIPLVMAAGDWVAPLVQGNPYINEVIPINLPWMERYSKSDWHRMIREIRNIRDMEFPVVINFRKALRENLISLLAGIPVRYGFNVTKSAWIHTHHVPYNPTQHIVENYLDLVEAYGAQRYSGGLEIFLTEEECMTPLQRYNLHEPYLIIAPGSGFTPKLWINERWYLLVDWLQTFQSWNIVLTGSLKEYAFNEQIAAGQSLPVLNLAGKVTLRELAAIISKADFLITVDSAAMHIGAAMRTPTVALFGPTDPKHWGPYPPDLPAVVISKPYMENITLHDVQDAVEKILSKISKTKLS